MSRSPTVSVPAVEGPAPAARVYPVGRWAAGAGEVVAAFGAAAVSVLLSTSIAVDPLNRVGQVSGVAALDLRFLVVGLLVVVTCLVAGHAHPQAWSVARRCAPAAIAGLATGLIGGGVLVALSGTDWPLFANAGDSGQLIRWADDLLAGRPVPAGYPPVAIHLVAGLAELTGDNTAGALRTFQIAATSAFGPIAYLSWRLVTTPLWALAVTLVAAVPVLEPYKPYTTVVLVALVPVLITFAGVLRTAQKLTWARLAVVGVGTGVLLGVLFAVYSGWFVWSAPGALVATLVVFPWRTAVRRGLALLGLTAAGLLAVAWPHLIGILEASGTVQDRFFYFDTLVDPAYIAMWRNDLPGDTGPWPPPGELAGVGVFTALLVVGLGAAVALGGRRTSVIMLCSLLAGAWLMRLGFASAMYATGSVQLYPRTTPEILFCLLLLSIVAVRLGARRLGDLARRWDDHGLLGGANGQGTREAERTTRAATIGVLCAGLLLALSMGSSVADRHMPRDDDSVGLLAYAAQMVRQVDGTCPDHSDRCVANVGEVPRRAGG